MSDDPVSLDVVVLPAFHGVLGFSELQPWLDGERFEERRSLPGLVDRLLVADGWGIVPTGIGKAEAATTVATLLASDAVDCDDAHFVTAGISGGPPHAGPLGSISIGDCVVDWDRKTRLPEGEGDGEGGRPIDLLQFRERDYVYRLNEGLAADAADAVRETDLRSPTEESPVVERGTVLSGDEYWHGASLGDQAEWLVDAYDAGNYRTTEMESAGIAVALDRHDLLDRYVSVRALANYDRPRDDRSAGESVDEETGEYAIDVAAENAYRAGRTVVDLLLSSR
jgi:purine nucleoside permease